MMTFTRSTSHLFEFGILTGEGFVELSSHSLYLEVHLLGRVAVRGRVLLQSRQLVHHPSPAKEEKFCDCTRRISDKVEQCTV